MREQEKTPGHEPHAAHINAAEINAVANAAAYPPTTKTPGHLVTLPCGRWALWRWFAVRGAGFPVATLERLASPEYASAADRVLAAEAEARQAFERALALVNKALDELKSAGLWDDPVRRKPLLKVLRSLKDGKIPRMQKGELPEAVQSLDRLADSRVATVEALAAFKQEFASGALRIVRAIQEEAGRERFREAIIWQNLHAFKTGVAYLLRNPSESFVKGTRQRQNLEMLASYMQRYCAKNDTIGFFGPVGWGKFVDGAEAVVARPGRQFLAARNVYFEGWGIDALAELVAKEKAVEQFLAPRRMAYTCLHGTTLYLPQRGPTKLNEKDAVLLQACDGRQPARRIAARLISDRPQLFRSEQVVYAMLENLRLRGLIFWGIELPIELYPERTLRRLLDNVEDEELRRRMLEPLDELEEARDAVAGAAGDPDRLEAAIGNMQEVFTRRTGADSTRFAGEVYAGRTLVYEDCRRDLELGIGDEVLKSVAGPLSLLLAGARWYTAEAAKLYRGEFEKVYDALARKAGNSVVELVDFWGAARGLVTDSQRPVDSLRPILQEHWAEILNVTPGERRLQYSTEELRPRVMSAFVAERPGWSAARYHSPDLMISATSLEAIRRGDYQIVLGEIHMALNTLGFSLFLAQHPAPQELFRAFESDMPGPGVVWVLNKYLIPEKTARVFITLESPNDFRIEISSGSSDGAEGRTIPVGELVVERRQGALRVRTRDGRHEFDIIELFGIILSGVVVDHYKILSPDPHTPRVTFDRFVVCRETWRLTPAETAFAFVKDEAERFVEARRWAAAHGLPRCVFVKAPVEGKPFFVDFDSHLYVNILARILRRTQDSDLQNKSVTVTEMLPEVGQSWLPDAQGNRYTCELRIAALDLSA